MPKATEHTTTSRRRLLGGGAVLAAAAGAVAAPSLAAPAGNPDANLIRWADEALRADLMDTDLTNDLRPDQKTPEIAAESKRLNAIWSDRMARCIGRPARTPEGLRAKARLLHNLLPKDTSGNLFGGSDADWDEQIAWSLVQDVLMGR